MQHWYRDLTYSASSGASRNSSAKQKREGKIYLLHEWIYPPAASPIRSSRLYEISLKQAASSYGCEDCLTS